MNKFLKLFIISLFFLIPNISLGAVSFDAATHSGYGDGATLTFAHTTTGDNRLLVVYVYDGVNKVTGVTYNGTAMTFLNERLMTGAAAGQYIQMYYLLNPTVGANNVVVSSGTVASIYASAVSYAGVKQTGQPDTQTTNGADTGTTLTTSATTTADNCWIMGYAYHNSDVSAGTNTTLRGGSGTNIQSFDTNAAQTPAGSHSVQTVGATSDFSGHVVAAFSPSVTVGDTSITSDLIWFD